MVLTFPQSFSFIPIILIFFLQFNISVAMATKQIQQFGQNSYAS